MRWVMKKITGKWGRAALTGGLCGVLNGLFGAGGGIAAVPLLKAGGLEQKKAHATSLAVILPLAVTSAVSYLAQGTISVEEALPYLPGGFLGACAGALLMKKIPALWLRRVFALFLIYAAVRLLLK